MHLLQLPSLFCAFVVICTQLQKQTFLPICTDMQLTSIQHESVKWDESIWIEWCNQNLEQVNGRNSHDDHNIWVREIWVSSWMRWNGMKRMSVPLCVCVRLLQARAEIKKISTPGLKTTCTNTMPWRYLVVLLLYLSCQFNPCISLIQCWEIQSQNTKWCGC